MSGFWDRIVESLGSNSPSPDASQSQQTPTGSEASSPSDSRRGSRDWAEEELGMRPAKKRSYTGATRYSFGGKHEEFNSSLKPSEAVKMWMQLLPRWHITIETEPDRMYLLARRGVPYTIRGDVWKVISGSKILREKNPGVYQLMVEKELDEEDARAMSKDVNRTFPSHTHFQEKEGRGQTSLLNVLRAYANLDPEVGYCQGMSFLSATLVSQLHEEDAFWTLVSILKTQKLRGLYLPGLPLLKHFIFRLSSLIKAYLPQVATHLSNIGMKHMFYCAEWFETLFSYNSNFELTLRIWDCMIVEGPLYLCRVALAIMKLNQKEILARNFEGNMMYIKQAASSLSIPILECANRWRGMGPLLKKIDETFEMYREEILSHQDVIVPKKPTPPPDPNEGLLSMLGEAEEGDTTTRISGDIYDRM
eukprot:TRINITY_DN345_c0_g1_i1.p1 TRINITY_DN345_c0_g1~~TRINITY_DN345_c0_g1_i1.p1  ORF type:complete len:420 (-),score=59.70 TRINITY_DN345_c0_g1_i1:457-1716(-)